MTLATWPVTDESKHHFSFYPQFFTQDNKQAGELRHLHAPAKRRTKVGLAWYALGQNVRHHIT